MQDENEAISALTGLSLNHILSDLSLPSGSGLSNQLGISGLPSITSNQIYGGGWDDDGAVGIGAGEDYEDEVDLELEQDEDDVDVKMEEDSMYGSQRAPRRVKIVKRLVERPKSVYERFPTYEKDKILDFTDLFKGYTVHKSRISKRPFHGELYTVQLSGHALTKCFSRYCVSAEEGSSKRVLKEYCGRCRTAGRVQACGRSGSIRQY